MKTQILRKINQKFGLKVNTYNRMDDCAPFRTVQFVFVIEGRKGFYPQKYNKF